MNGRYKLVGHKPVPVEDVLEWAKWFETSDKERLVALWKRDGLKRESVMVSTVFLGVDHNFTGDGPPRLFETKVFGGALNGEQDRYATWDEAERGHADILARVLAELGTIGWA